MKLLVVEDEIGIASFLKQGLEEEGYEVLTASNGQSGIDLALSVDVDLILLDWMLPKITGIGFERFTFKIFITLLKTLKNFTSWSSFLTLHFYNKYLKQI